MEVRQISGNTFCLMGQILIPIYMTDSKHCIMLDTGARWMREELAETMQREDITPIGLLCSHIHYDHFGNARYFADRFGCPVALPLGEAEGCRTLDSLRSHMEVYTEGQLAADPVLNCLPCLIDHVIRPEEQDTMFRGVRFGVLRTSGHSLDHVSYITPDNVCYTGDAIMCGPELEHAKMPYAYNIKQYMESTRRIGNVQCEAMVAAHYGILRDGYAEVAEQNRKLFEKEVGRIAELIDHDMTTEEVFRAVVDALSFRVDTVKRALFLQRLMMPYLHHLVDTGVLTQTLRDCVVCYAPAGKL